MSHARTTNASPACCLSSCTCIPPPAPLKHITACLQLNHFLSTQDTSQSKTPTAVPVALLPAAVPYLGWPHLLLASDTRKSYMSQLKANPTYTRQEQLCSNPLGCPLTSFKQAGLQLTAPMSQAAIVANNRYTWPSRIQ